VSVPALTRRPRPCSTRPMRSVWRNGPQEDQRRPKQTVAAVGTSLGPPWSSSDDTPPPGVEAEELVQEDKSSSENE